MTSFSALLFFSLPSWRFVHFLRSFARLLLVVVPIDNFFWVKRRFRWEATIDWKVAWYQSWSLCLLNMSIFTWDKYLKCCHCFFVRNAYSPNALSCTYMLTTDFFVLNIDLESTLNDEWAERIHNCTSRLTVVKRIDAASYIILINMTVMTIDDVKQINKKKLHWQYFKMHDLNFPSLTRS